MPLRSSPKTLWYPLALSVPIRGTAMPTGIFTTETMMAPNRPCSTQAFNIKTLDMAISWEETGQRKDEEDSLVSQDGAVTTKGVGCLLWHWSDKAKKHAAQKECWRGISKSMDQNYTQLERPTSPMHPNASIGLVPASWHRQAADLCFETLSLIWTYLYKAPRTTAPMTGHVDVWPRSVVLSGPLP